MDPTQLSYELRKGANEDLTRRRWIIGLSMVGSVMAQLVSLYQTGIIRRLPDPPLSIFDSSRVDASDYAYKRLNSPDGPFMLINYGVTAALASAGGQNRAHDQPWLPIALGLKTIGDAVTALELAREEWEENRAFCAYCQTATLCSLASVALAWPEMRKAIGTLRERRNP